MSSGFSFGTGGGGGFSFSAPSTNTTSSATSGGFSFGLSTPAASTATTSSIGSFSAGSGLTFPSFNAGATAATTSSTSMPSSSLSGFSFGSSVATSANTLGGSSGAAIPATTPLFNLSSGSSTSGTNTTASSSSAFNAPKPITTTASTATGGGFNLNPVASATSVNTISAGGAVAATPIAFGSSTSAALSTATTTTTFGASGAGGQSGLSMRQLEEKLNKWLVELKEQEERFVRQAAHVNAWDQILQKGHNEVHTLKETLNTVKADQSRLEAEIDFIRGQQDELERLLEPLETATNTTLATQMHQGDRQRDNMYYLAQSLDAQLRQMTDDLAKVIEHLNTNSSSAQPNDPVTLVTRILSAHMDTLKWVDQNASVLAQKVEDVARITGNTSRKLP